MTLPNYDAWLEPPDEGVCEDGCVLEDPHGECLTDDDLREQAALERWDEERDERHAG